MAVYKLVFSTVSASMPSLKTVTGFLKSCLKSNQTPAPESVVYYEGDEQNPVNPKFKVIRATSSTHSTLEYLANNVPLPGSPPKNLLVGKVVRAPSPTRATAEYLAFK